MSKQVDSLRTLVNKIAAGGPEALKARHTERGKLMARQVRNTTSNNKRSF